MLTDIILPVYNQLKYTKLFVKSLFSEKNWNLIVIDNGSDLNTRDFLKSIKENIKIIRNEENLGYVKAVNQGLEVSTADSILLANNDCIVSPGLIKRLQEGLNKYDLIGPLTNNVGDKESPILIKYKLTSIKEFNKFSIDLFKKNENMFSDVEFLYGHCLMIKKEVLKKLGLLDERYGAGNYDDLDYCRRALNKGFKIGIRKDSIIYHFLHTTFDSIDIDVNKLINKNKEIFDKKWE